jgi:hypothetical protein
VWHAPHWKRRLELIRSKTGVSKDPVGGAFRDVLAVDRNNNAGPGACAAIEPVAAFGTHMFEARLLKCANELPRLNRPQPGQVKR